MTGLKPLEVKGINPFTAVNSARYVERTITDLMAKAFKWNPKAVAKAAGLLDNLSIHQQ